jgi:putative membrane protein
MDKGEDVTNGNHESHEEDDEMNHHRHHFMSHFKQMKPYASHFLIPKWKKMENKGNLARDFLANERTFLAWMRTALHLIAIGLAIVKFLYFDANEILIKITGVILISMGILAVVYAWIRTLVLTKQIEDDIFSTDTLGPLLFLISGITVGVLCLLIVFI